MSQHGTSRQSGFTLIELLITLALTLLIVVAVQRYVAGVTTDQSHLSAQQDQTSQMNISLSNIQNDVARAGFVPLASAKEFTLIDEPVQIGFLPIKFTNNTGVQNIYAWIQSAMERRMSRFTRTESPRSKFNTIASRTKISRPDRLAVPDESARSARAGTAAWAPGALKTALMLNTPK